MPHEQRRHRRYDVNGVHGSLGLSVDARLLNMSLTGMAIECGSMLKVGGSVFLSVPHREDHLRFRTDVKWCHLVRTERKASGDTLPVYLAGLDFRETLDEYARRILAFLEENITIELEHRLTGRFRMAQDAIVEMRQEFEFEVQRLSMGGVLVTCACKPPIDAEVEVEINGRRGTVCGQGRVRSVLPAETSEPWESALFAIGIQLLGLTPEDQRSLADILDDQLY